MSLWYWLDAKGIRKLEKENKTLFKAAHCDYYIKFRELFNFISN